MSKSEPWPRSENNGRSAILVVEDEVLVRMAIAEQLRQAGYPVIEAADAHEALQVLRHGRDVKVVVTDVRMPGSIDGVDLARLTRTEFPGTKVVLVSANPPAIDWVEHDGYFRKPYNFAQLVAYVKRLME